MRLCEKTSRDWRVRIIHEIHTKILKQHLKRDLKEVKLDIHICDKILFEGDPFRRDCQTDLKN